MKKRIFVVAAVIISSQLHAQQDSLSSHSLDEVVLTASKYPRKQTETGKVIHVINQQQIEKSIGKSLGELLNTVPGTIILGANNNAGTNLTPSIRGASSGNVLILLDGIPVNDPSVITNYFDLNFIPLDQVERIEILKGGQSTLYGSDAVAGVINIISKKASDKKFSVNGNLAGGSYQTLKQSIGLNGKNSAIDYSIHYTHISTNGFSVAHDTTGNGAFDKDGLNQHAVFGKVGINILPRLKLSLSGQYNHYKTDLDASAFNDDRDYVALNDNMQGGTSLTYNWTKGLTQLNYSYNRSERDYRDDSLHKSNVFAYYSRSKYIGRTHFAELYQTWKCNQLEFLAGVDYRWNNTDQTYFSIGAFGPYATEPLSVKMSQVSPYTSVVFKKDALTIEIGGRLNHHSEYGNNFSYTLNPSYVLFKRLKLFANLYSAFKTPTLYQLFDPFAGNMDLQPEESIVGELGGELFKQSYKFRLIGFYRKATDPILYSYDPNNFTSKYINAGEQLNYGLEFEGEYQLGQFSVRGNYTYTDGETTTAYDGTGTPLGKDTTYFNLYRIPKHAINLNLGWQICKPVFLSVQSRTVSKREEFIYGSSPITLEGYSLLDVYGEYKFEKFIKLFIDLKNITNKEYIDIPGYSTRKFNVTGGVSFQF